MDDEVWNYRFDWSRFYERLGRGSNGFEPCRHQSQGDILSRMRVIAGIHRGRPLVAPPGLATRPILDRVKVALFDWLGARLAMPGRLPALHVLDLYSGAGSLGIEAISRGAASATFVERDPAALQCLRENLQALKIDIATVVPAAAETLLARPSQPNSAFGLIFLDPPYPLSENVEADSPMVRVFERLGEQVPIESDATLVWRHDIRFSAPPRMAGRWHTHEVRSYGTMTITLYRPFAAEEL